jgi:hypothetical protein
MKPTACRDRPALKALPVYVDTDHVIGHAATLKDARRITAKWLDRQLGGPADLTSVRLAKGSKGEPQGFLTGY